MKLLGFAIVAWCLAIAEWGRASELEIIGFDSGQGLQFQGGTLSNFYTLEFAPTLDGPWTNWGSVSSAAITGTVMSLPAPFFYRIVETPAGSGHPANEPSWTAASNSVVYTNDARLTDARTPLAHTQAWGSITDAPAIPSTNGLARLAELTNTMALASLALPASATIDWETGSHAALIRTNHTGNVNIIGDLALEYQPIIATVQGISNAEGDLTGDYAGDYLYIWSGAEGTNAILNYGPTFLFQDANGITKYLGGTNMVDSTNAFAFQCHGSSWTDVSNNPVFVNIIYQSFVSVKSGTIGIGTNSPRKMLPSRKTPIGIDMVDKVYAVEHKMGQIGPVPSTPAISALGYDIRQNGRAALWLNSYNYTWNGDNYDNSADIYFGTGNSLTDSSIRWSITSRYTNNLSRHDGDGQFAIFEGLGSGAMDGTYKRLGIFPQRNGVSGPIWMGFDATYPNPRPADGVTLMIMDSTKNPSLVVAGLTNANTSTRPQIHWKAGTNDIQAVLIASNAAFSFLRNGAEVLGIRPNGTIVLPSLTLGTNSAISNWPAGGSKTMAEPASILVTADYTVQDDIRAIGADTTANDIAVTLPDPGGGFRSLLVRKFSAANTLTILRGTTVLHTLRADGAVLEYDWWPDRTNWYLRNP